MNLAEIKEGESAILTEIGGAGALRQHFLDMGLIPGTRVTASSSSSGVFRVEASI